MDKNDMRLSIVVNMYNTAKYMPRCVETLLEQDIPQSDYEIILVDDCSPDNSLEMAKEYATRYRNIRVCTHEKNKGLAAARNTGIDAAKGQYLCFVDPDDYIEKNNLSALLKQMDEEKLDMLRFNYQKVDEEYNLLPDTVADTRFDYSPRIMTGTEFIATRLGAACYVWAYIYRLDFIKSTGIRFFERCFFDDTPWLPRVLQKAQRVNVNPVRHQYYLQRSTSMVHSRDKNAVLRKADMQIQLINILSEQKGNAPVEIYKWYDMMFALMAVTLLTNIGLSLYDERRKYVGQLRALKLFPLSTYNAVPKGVRAIHIANISPYLLILVVHIKSKFSSVLKFKK